MCLGVREVPQSQLEYPSSYLSNLPAEWVKESSEMFASHCDLDLRNQCFVLGMKSDLRFGGA